MRVKKEILDASLVLIDDSPTSLKLFTSILQGAGFHRILTFEDESQALVYLLTHSPDLVLLDMILHKTTAVEILKTLKNNINTRHLPVIVLSHSSDNALIIQCLELGAEDFIPKESNPIEILVRVNNILSQHYYIKSLFEKNRRLEEDIRFVAHVQEKFQQFNNVRLSKHNIDVIWKPYNIASGDFYFARSFTDDRTFFFLLDVSGHGVGASLVGFYLHFLTQQWIISHPLSTAQNLKEYVDWINNNIEKEYGSMGIFLSGIFGLLDEKNNQIHLISTGSPPVIIQTNDFEILRLKNFVALGVVPFASFSVETFSTTQWKRMLFFTDGVYEIQTPEKEMLNVEGFIAILSSLEKDKKFSLSNLYNRIAKEYNYHFEDDVSILMVEKKE
jgi:sigma-B regulation protein RsbU (phosphoserine phosphatase)